MDGSRLRSSRDKWIITASSECCCIQVIASVVDFHCISISVSHCSSALSPFVVLLESFRLQVAEPFLYLSPPEWKRRWRGPTLGSWCPAEPAPGRSGWAAGWPAPRSLTAARWGRSAPWGWSLPGCWSECSACTLCCRGERRARTEGSGSGFKPVLTGLTDRI